MEPSFKEGAVALFNKCIEGKTDDFKPGTVVLVEPLFKPKRIRTIKKKEQLESSKRKQHALQKQLILTSFLVSVVLIGLFGLIVFLFS